MQAGDQLLVALDHLGEGLGDLLELSNAIEAMERRGFAVSVTETGETGAVRVRLGNFVARDDAERQLRALRQEGLKGIVINLPQAFRPESTSAAQ
jgi:hypothetical protein